MSKNKLISEWGWPVAAGAAITTVFIGTSYLLPDTERAKPVAPLSVPYDAQPPYSATPDDTEIRRAKIHKVKRPDFLQAGKKIGNVTVQRVGKVPIESDNRAYKPDPSAGRQDLVMLESDRISDVVLSIIGDKDADHRGAIAISKLGKKFVSRFVTYDESSRVVNSTERAAKLYEGEINTLYASLESENGFTIDVEIAPEKIGHLAIVEINPLGAALPEETYSDSFRSTS